MKINDKNYRYYFSRPKKLMAILYRYFNNYYSIKKYFDIFDYMKKMFFCYDL